MRDFELSLKLRDLMVLEKKRSEKRKKKVRWAEYLAGSVPVVCGAGPNREWVQRLKDKLKNNLEL